MNLTNYFKSSIAFFLFLISLSVLLYWFCSKCIETKNSHIKDPISLYKIDISDVIEKKNIIPIAIIGSGPAGLSAALYGARASIYTVVFQGKQPGGQLTTTSYVENWPGTPKSLGSALINQSQKQAEHFGAVMVSDSIVKVDFSSWPFVLYTEEGSKINALSVIIATGSTPKILNIPGEQEYWGKGVTTCAICDAPYFKDRSVVVVGGGDSAVEEAVLLASFAKEVTVLVRGETMRAAPTMMQRLPQYNTQVTKILGDGKEVQSVELNSSKNNVKSDFKVDGVFLAIGHNPNANLFKDYLDTDSNGYLQLQPRTQQTSMLGIFAAGDVCDPTFKQAGVAAGDGIKAALGAVSFLLDHGFTDALAKKLEKNYFELQYETATKEVKNIKDIKEFEKDFAISKDPVVIDFYAPTCPSCMHMLPVVSAVAAQFEDKAKFLKINTAEAKELAEKFKVASIPTLLIIKDGKELSRSNEIMSKRQLYNYISQFVY